MEARRREGNRQEQKSDWNHLFGMAQRAKKWLKSLLRLGPERRKRKWFKSLSSAWNSDSNHFFRLETQVRAKVIEITFSGLARREDKKVIGITARRSSSWGKAMDSCTDALAWSSVSTTAGGNASASNCEGKNGTSEWRITQNRGHTDTKSKPFCHVSSERRADDETKSQPMAISLFDRQECKCQNTGLIAAGGQIRKVVLDWRRCGWSSKVYVCRYSFRKEINGKLVRR